MNKQIKKWYQRAKRGYADSDVWDFDYYLGTVLAGGLKQLAETTNSYPCSFKSGKEWKKLLKEMAKAFQGVIDYEDTGWEKDKDFTQRKKVYKNQEKALKNLVKIFPALWD